MFKNGSDAFDGFCPRFSCTFRHMGGKNGVSFFNISCKNIDVTSFRFVW